VNILRNCRYQDVILSHLLLGWSRSDGNMCGLSSSNSWPLCPRSSAWTAAMAYRLSAMCSLWSVDWWKFTHLFRTSPQRLLLTRLLQVRIVNVHYGLLIVNTTDDLQATKSLKWHIQGSFPKNFGKRSVGTKKWGFQD